MWLPKGMAIGLVQMECREIEWGKIGKEGCDQVANGLERQQKS